MRLPEHPFWLALLTPPSWLYGRAVAWRNHRFERTATVHRAGLPVISVGNLTVGGTGKTPIVAWLARHLQSRGLTPAVVTRGYGGRAGRGPLLVSAGAGPLCPVAESGDEPALLARELPGAIVVAGSDRVAGARRAGEEGADAVVLDDGFQHRRLARDLDLVLLDARNPFGNERLLPAGPLREPPRGLARADLILLTRARRSYDLGSVEQAIRRHNSTVPVLRACHRPVGFVDANGESSRAPRRALAFCGIGNPESFRNDLESQRVEVVAFRVYPDHHVYSRRDLARLSRSAERAGATLVTTEKDRMRLDSFRTGAAAASAILALRIEAVLDQPQPLTEAVGRAMGGSAA